MSADLSIPIKESGRTSDCTREGGNTYRYTPVEIEPRDICRRHSQQRMTMFTMLWNSYIRTLVYQYVFSFDCVLFSTYNLIYILSYLLTLLLLIIILFTRYNLYIYLVNPSLYYIR